MTAAALVRLARQGELAEGQKIIKVGMVPAAAWREGRAARAGTSAEPLWPQLLVGLHPAPWAAQQWWAARGSCAEPGRQPLLLLGGGQLWPGQRSPLPTAAANRSRPAACPAGDAWQEDPAGPHARPGVRHRRTLLPYGW